MAPKAVLVADLLMVGLSAALVEVVLFVVFMVLVMVVIVVALNFALILVLAVIQGLSAVVWETSMFVLLLITFKRPWSVFFFLIG